MEVLIHARRHGLLVLIGDVFAYHLRINEAITANAAMPLVAGEHVRTPLGASRVVFGIGHFDNQINFEGLRYGPHSPKTGRPPAPESPKSAHIAPSGTDQVWATRQRALVGTSFARGRNRGQENRG